MPRRGRLRVLLVDDSPEFVEQAEALLGAHPRLAFEGWAFSASDALDLLRTVDIDLVFMDLSMPGIGGLEAMGRIQARHPATRVVILTLHDGPEYRRVALAGGADGFVSKACLADELDPLLDQLFGSQAAGRGGS